MGGLVKDDLVKDDYSKREPDSKGTDLRFNSKMLLNHSHNLKPEHRVSFSDVLWNIMKVSNFKWFIANIGNEEY